MDLVNDDTCDYCSEQDTLIHRFISCPVCKSFWTQFISMWNQCIQTPLHLSDRDKILGIYVESSYTINNCILLAKQFIHKQKCKNKNISFNAFRHILKPNILMEKCILIRNNKENMFSERWQQFLEYLS